jgi:hypothetical protein
MATPNIARLEEGDTYDSASVNTRLQSLADTINNLEEESFAEHALRHFHLPSFVVRQGQKTIGEFRTGKVYLVETWTVAVSAVGSQLQLTFDPTPLTDDVRYLVVLANINLRNIRDLFSVTPASKYDEGNIAAFRIEWYDGASWAPVPEALGVYSQDNVLGSLSHVHQAVTGNPEPAVYHDIPLLGVLRASDLPAGASVSGFRVTLQAMIGGGAGAWPVDGLREITIQEGTLSYFGLYSGLD